VFEAHCDCTVPAQAPPEPMASATHVLQASPGVAGCPAHVSAAHACAQGPLPESHVQLRMTDPRYCAPDWLACTQHDCTHVTLLAGLPSSAAQHAAFALALGQVESVVA
jgi:hypothetical protein